MSTELARRVAHMPSVADNDFLNEVRTQIAPKATDAELRFFANVVAKTQLDPWSRQIYLIPRWDGRVKREVHRPQVSIDGLRLVAERTGKYEGQTPVEWCGDDGVWKDVWLSSDQPRAAKVGVYKAGRAHPTYSVAHWDEYVVLGKDKKPSGLWPSKGALMLAKCVEALALRKNFPQETSGLYTPDEMGSADVAEAIEATVVDEPATLPAPEWRPSDEDIAELRGLYEQSGWMAALPDPMPEDFDAHTNLRMRLLAVGAGNQGPLRGLLEALTRERYDALKTQLVEASVTETFDATEVEASK